MSAGKTPGKVCWFDVETTGLDHLRNGIIQLAMMVDIDGIVEEEFEFKILPYKGDVIDEEALKHNGLTIEMINTQIEYRNPVQVLSLIKNKLGKYVNRFDREDKLAPAGYNPDFDIRFLKKFWEKGGDKYFGSFFNYYMIDPFRLLLILRHIGLVELEKYDLSTACAYFGISFEKRAHDAFSDIKATRELYYILVREFLTNRNGKHGG